jgi:predicted amidohydrolase
MAHCRQIVTRSAAEVRHRGIPKAAANPIGFDGAAWWPGNSFVIDARGRVVCWLKGENRPARMQASFGVAELEFD